ncbi:MAG: F0F1 ATP synthase subunit B [Calditrichaceae bacterium]|jgi:F-type H+-transporting ATPase subunit b
MLKLDPGMIIWTWLAFLFVLAILSKVALKPMLNVINKRENQIRGDIENAIKQRDEAEELLNKHRQMLSGAEDEAQKIIKENQRLAEKNKQAMIDEARKEAEKIIENSKAEIERQKDSALNSLRAEIADLAIGAAEKIIIQKLDKTEHDNVINEYIKNMPKSEQN